MNDEILKLAKECGLKLHYDELEGFEAFYRAAFNAGAEWQKAGRPDADGNHDIYLGGEYTGRGKVRAGTGTITFKEQP